MMDQFIQSRDCWGLDAMAGRYNTWLTGGDTARSRGPGFQPTIFLTWTSWRSSTDSIPVIPCSAHSVFGVCSLVFCVCSSPSSCSCPEPTNLLTTASYVSNLQSNLRYHQLYLSPLSDHLVSCILPELYHSLFWIDFNIINYLPLFLPLLSPVVLLPFKSVLETVSRCFFSLNFSLNCLIFILWILSSASGLNFNQNRMHTVWQHNPNPKLNTTAVLGIFEEWHL